MTAVRSTQDLADNLRLPAGLETNTIEKLFVVEGATESPRESITQAPNTIKAPVPALPQVAAEPALAQPVQPLFRQEVIESRRTQWLGTVLLTPKNSDRYFSWFAGLCIVAILGLLFFASYTRSQRVTGWLVPDKGMVRVVAPRSGIITKLHVRDGQPVSKDEPLATLNNGLRSASLGDTQSEVLSGINSRRDSYLAELALIDPEFTARQSALRKLITALRQEEKSVAGEITIQQTQVELSGRTKDRMAQARATGLVTANNFELAETSYIDNARALYSLKRNRSTIQRQIVAQESELELLPVQTERRRAELVRQIAALDQDLAVAESQREVIVYASTAGDVTGVRIEQGSSVDPSTSMLSIVPDGSLLQAHLFVPSVAVGFIQAGQQVKLRYRAFPYQKFGHHEGVISNVSLSSVNPNELGASMTGLTALLPQNEPVYIVTVDLARQSVTAYGDQIPLQAGMQLQADIQIETRRLIEWVLDPLYTVIGRSGA